MKTTLSIYLNRQSALIDRALERHLPSDRSVLARAMRYAVKAGGKRLRPMLVIEGARLCGMPAAPVLPAACAMEFIHTYSLVHDDLPSMDNDDLRRGKPTCHRKFGEATAILAGDALLTDAFRLIAETSRDRRIDPSAAARAVAVAAAAAGSRGMVAGQAADTLETDAWTRKSKKAAAQRLEFIHLNKTAALLRGSLLVGAVLAGGSDRQQKALDTYGRCIGIAFQIADDILDIEGDKKLLGKKGSDRDNNKLTYPALHGMDESRRAAGALVAAAKKALRVFGESAGILRQLADYTVERRY